MFSEPFLPFGLMLKYLKICLNTIQCNKYSVNTFLIYAKTQWEREMQNRNEEPIVPTFKELPSSRTTKISAPINGYCTTLKQNLLMVIFALSSRRELSVNSLY